jgi:hypothetical protein
MANTGTAIVLLAGTLTFSNEWYQTGKVNFKVPIATLLAAAAIDGLSHIDDKAGVGLSIMVLIGAVTVKFGGKSVVDTIAQIFSKTSTNTSANPKTKVTTSSRRVA